MRIVTLQRNVADLSKVMPFPAEIDGIPEQASDSEIAALLAPADAFLGAELKAEWLAAKPAALQLVQSVGAGYDAIACDALPAGCTVCNVYGHDRAVAEHAFMMMLVLQKQLFASDAALRRGDWGWSNRIQSELRGRSLLILGLGVIGRELVRWGKFFDMQVSALTRTPSAERAKLAGLSDAGGLDSLDSVLPNADFVVIALPGLPETRDLIGERQLGLMKPTAFLVNVGRGPVVNEAALFDALQGRKIAGAGVDVWYEYPKPNESKLPSTLPFQELNNIVMTPHNGGYTHETMQHRWAAIAENFRRFAAGEPLLSVVYQRPK
ncbi:MAG: 2-hydroxyacid dehydrogenase [Bryobacteraceae bacterium]